MREDAQSTEMWRVVKGMRNDIGSKDMEEVSLEEWEKLYQKILAEDRDQFDIKIIEQQIEYLEVPRPGRRINLESMKNGRSLGLDNEPIELIKYGTNKIIDRINKFLNTCLSAN